MCILLRTTVVYNTARSSSDSIPHFPFYMQTTTIAQMLSIACARACAHARAHTHTRLTALCPGLPRWAGTRKVKPSWILLKQETVSGNGISCAVCKSAPRSRQTTTPAPHLCFYKPCPSCRPTNSVKALKACCLLQERGNHKRHLEPLWDIGVVTMGNKNFPGYFKVR